MADLRLSGISGTPFGGTSDRPSSPTKGQTYFNGDLGCLEIYTGTSWVASSAPPAIPSIGTLSQYNSVSTYSATSSVSVPVNSGAGGGLANSYTVTSSPGSLTATSTSSPVVVTGLTNGTSYTFTSVATNNFNTSAASAASSSITPTTAPQAPTIGTASLASATSVSLAFTAGATGGSTITNYKYSTDGTNYTAFSPAQTTSPLTISGLTNVSGSSYTFYLKAVNANGDSVASSASNIVVLVKADGGIVTTDALYTVHKFNSNGTFTPLANLTVEYLVLAGGGGGGDGGGGAGGLLYHTAKSLTAQPYTITIGAGGPGGPYPSTNGVNTTAFGVTAYGGGRGGNQTGYSGGSGSGGGRYGTTSGASATQTTQDGATGYGNAGGNGNQNTYDSGGGGGGAGGVGGDGGSNGFGGVGGNGRTYSISGSSVVYATGGGGHSQAPSHTGSLGGSSNVNGGKGNSPSGSVAATNATENTGSGGGGGGGSSGGAGGSGIVIVRYLS